MKTWAGLLATALLAAAILSGCIVVPDPWPYGGGYYAGPHYRYPYPYPPAYPPGWYYRGW